MGVFGLSRSVPVRRKQNCRRALYLRQTLLATKRLASYNRRTTQTKEASRDK